MYFGLVGVKRRKESSVGHNKSSRDAGLSHKEYCIRAGGHSRANALCKSAKIVGKGEDPHIFVGSADKMEILKGAAGDFFYDRIAFAVAVLLGSANKTGGIGKYGAGEVGRGILRSGIKLPQRQQLSAELVVDSWRLRSTTLACNLVTSQRAVTNKAWVAVQLADSVLLFTVSAATAERLLVVEVVRLAKASSVSC